MATAARRQRRSPDIWPGFVDALSSLLIIIIFLLMVFTLAQFFLSETLSGRNEALARLNRQVAQLVDELSLARGENVELQQSLSQVSTQLQNVQLERDQMSAQLAELLPERDALAAMLSDRNTELSEMSVRASASEARARQADERLADALKSVAVDKEKIELQLREIASLQRDITALRKVREDLEKKVTAAAAALDQSTKEVTSLRDRSKELEARLSTEAERTALAQKTIEEKDVKLRELLQGQQDAKVALTEEQKVSAQAKRQVELLNAQILALRNQLASIQQALEASEAQATAQGVQIVDLGKRLNAALASKVQELARYRSEFFGKLREVLGDREGIRIVGDRFVFQSEVLFTSGSATLQPQGQQQIEKLAATLIDIAKTIPKDINWVLRVDGHTDKIPIATPVFPSNWELSTARAISVVKSLVALGLPADRLAATGFGEFQPIDPADSADAYRRNRRIEFKLTER